MKKNKKAKPKFTPGPWHVGMRNGYNANFVYARDGVEAHNDSAICLVYGISQNRKVFEVAKEIGTPNAHLLAAAPEMYQQLEGIATWLECLADMSHKDSKDHMRFPPVVRAAHAADEAVYRKTIADIRKVMAKAEEKI